jgi:hypothetical protein
MHSNFGAQARPQATAIGAAASSPPLVAQGYLLITCLIEEFQLLHKYPSHFV